MAGVGAYTGSKCALAGMTGALRQEVAGADVDVVLVEPGLVATGFYDRALAELPAADRTEAYGDLYRVLDRIGVCRDAPPGVSEPSVVAETVVAAAAAESPDPRYRPALTGTPGALAAALLPPPVRDRAVRAGVAVLASGPVRWLLDSLADVSR